MSCRLDLSILREIGTTMTSRTLAQARVIHYRRRPGKKTTDVTGITLTAYRNMASWLGEGIGKNIRSAVAV